MVGRFNLTEYNGFLNSFPSEYKVIVIVLFLTLMITLYSLLVFYFHKFLARKNILNLNLSRYNKYKHPVIAKIFGLILYLIEYVIILPVATFLWFSFLVIFFLVFSQTQIIETILLITTSLVATIRITAYINEDLSKDLAKLIPLTVLAFFITEPSFFNISLVLERITKIPTLLHSIIYFLVFIVAIEFLLRMLYLVYTLLKDRTKI